MRNAAEKIAPLMQKAARLAAENARTRKSRSGSIGSAAVRSRSTNPASSAVPAMRAAIPLTSPQPESPTRTSAQAIRAVPPATSGTAGRSSPVAGPLPPRQEQRGTGDRHHPDRHVDPEDPVPVEALHHDAADQRSAGHRQPGDPAEDADDRPAPLRRERGGDDRQRQRRDGRRPEALRSAEGDQQP